MERKAQIHFGETIMVVIVLMFIVIIAMVFFSRVTQNNIKQEITYSKDLSSIKLAKYATSLPEISCGGLQEGSYCVDLLKLEKLAELIKNGNREDKDYYAKIFGYSEISFILGQVDNKDENNIITLYKSKPLNISASSTTYYFTTLHDPIVDSEDFTTMKITRYIAK